MKTTLKAKILHVGMEVSHRTRDGPLGHSPRGPGEYGR